MSTNQLVNNSEATESYDTVIIGGGQAGLVAGYYLTQQGKNFIILDENQRTGDSWRKRWESLKLFTPGKFDNLPGMNFPKQGDYLPTKDEVADYLEGYAKQLNLPISHATKVDCLERNGNGYQITSGSSSYHANNVIIATGPFQRPFTPAFSNELDPSILQIHSSDYLNPAQFTAQNILVVGAGNSGAEIALDLARAGRKVWLSGRDVGRLPVNGPLAKAFDGRLLWWMMSHLINVNTPIGKKVRAKELSHGTPLGRATREELINAGVELIPRVQYIESGKPRLEDGQNLTVDGVIWATGFRPDYSWLHLPIFDEKGYPQHWRGVIENEPGLFFVGLLFQTALNSSLIGGVSADAAYVVKKISQN